VTTWVISDNLGDQSVTTLDESCLVPYAVIKPGRQSIHPTKQSTYSHSIEIFCGCRVRRRHSRQGLLSTLLHPPPIIGINNTIRTVRLSPQNPRGRSLEAILQDSCQGVGYRVGVWGTPQKHGSTSVPFPLQTVQPSLPKAPSTLSRAPVENKTHPTPDARCHHCEYPESSEGVRDTKNSSAEPRTRLTWNSPATPGHTVCTSSLSA